MGLLNAGRNFLAQAMINDSSPTFFDNAHAYLCVGDGNTAYNAEQTDLQAATNKLRKGMDASYPTRSNNANTFRSTFATGDANFEWIEWGVANASSGGVLFNRKVESPSLGTKTNTQSWVLTATLTLGIGS